MDIYECAVVTNMMQPISISFIGMTHLQNTCAVVLVSVANIFPPLSSQLFYFVGVLCMCVSKHTNTWARFSYNNMRVISLSVPWQEGQHTCK